MITNNTKDSVIVGSRLDPVLEKRSGSVTVLENEGDCESAEGPPGHLYHLPDQ
jgi:hypothetical protein